MATTLMAILLRTMKVSPIRQLASAEEVSRAAAAEFVRIAGDAIAVHDRFTVSLSGGSTPRRLYELLARPPFNREIPWDRVEFFWGDERTVPPDHPHSNYRMANEVLLKKLTISEAHIHRMPAERQDREAAARDYQVEIARVFGADPDGEPPQFDLVLLGMGADGHTASLFPYTEALKDTNRWVVSNYIPSLESYRLTLTSRILNNAAWVMSLVAGKDKAESLAQVFEGPVDPYRLPAQLIRPQSGNLVWFADASAVSKLSRACPQAQRHRSFGKKGTK